MRIQEMIDGLLEDAQIDPLRLRPLLLVRRPWYQRLMRRIPMELRRNLVNGSFGIRVPEPSHG